MPLFDLSNTFMNDKMHEEKKCLTDNLANYTEKLKVIEKSRQEDFGS